MTLRLFILIAVVSFVTSAVTSAATTFLYRYYTAYKIAAEQIRCRNLTEHGIYVIKENENFRQRQCIVMNSEVCAEQNRQLTNKEIDELRRELTEQGCPIW